MGTLFNPAVREATGSLYQFTQRGSIPTNNGARRASSQLIDGDKSMSAYTSGILNLHIWQVTTWAALRAGQNTSSHSSIIGAIQS